MDNDRKLGDAKEVIRGHQIDDMVGADVEHRRARGLARASQVVDYGFYVLYSLLTIRLLLALIAARSSTGFVKLINAVTAPFYAMFRGIVASPTSDGGNTLALPLVIAIIVYAMLHLGVRALLRLIANRRTDL